MSENLLGKPAQNKGFADLYLKASSVPSGLWFNSHFISIMGIVNSALQKFLRFTDNVNALLGL